MKMKKAAVSLLLAFSITVFFGLATAANKPVLDIDGNELRTGVQYYVGSALWGAGAGALVLGRTRRQSCPEVVAVSGFSFEDGIPVIFSNANSSDDVVRLSTDINIEHVPIRDRLCLTSTVWKLDNYDESTGKWWVTTDGVKGNPGPSTVSNWFKIEKVGVLGYKFSFCPSVCNSCKTLCSDIGRYGDDGLLRLALVMDDDEGWGWPWLFKKADRIKQVVDATQ